jgi:flagellar protein FlbT
MQIFLRAKERIYVNGAVIRVDRKTTLELMNEATFLLENHVMQADQATTLIRQVYFAIQIMLMDPSATQQATQLARAQIDAALKAYRSPEIHSGLAEVSKLMTRSRNFEALKTLRGLFPFEAKEREAIEAATCPETA